MNTAKNIPKEIPKNLCKPAIQQTSLLKNKIKNMITYFRVPYL